MLKKNGYNVKVINLIDMSKSDCYNPFRYIREENDVIKLVTNIISNTTPKDGAPTDPFWTKFIMFGWKCQKKNRTFEL